MRPPRVRVRVRRPRMRVRRRLSDFSVNRLVPNVLTMLAAEPPPWAAGFFTGAPAPAGAGLLMLPMFISFEWGDWIARSPYLNGVWITGVALLMISTVPTISLKRIRIPPDFVVPTLLGIGLLAGLFTTAPWPTLTFI